MKRRHAGLVIAGGLVAALAWDGHVGLLVVVGAATGLLCAIVTPSTMQGLSAWVAWWAYFLDAFRESIGRDLARSARYRDRVRRDVESPIIDDGLNMRFAELRVRTGGTVQIGRGL
jgi:hypothetical protein